MNGDRNRWITAALALAISFIISIPVLFLPYMLHESGVNEWALEIFLGTGTGFVGVLVLGACGQIEKREIALISLFLIIFEIAELRAFGQNLTTQLLLIWEPLRFMLHVVGGVAAFYIVGQPAFQAWRASR